MAPVTSTASASDLTQLNADQMFDLQAKLKEQLKLEGRLLIQFQDGSSDIYELRVLKQLSFFQVLSGTQFQEALTSQTQFHDIDRKVFRLVCDFVVEKKPIRELITAEMLQNNLTLFESFTAVLNFLHPIESFSSTEAQEALGRNKMDERSDTLAWQLAALIDFEAAKAIVEAYKGKNGSKDLSDADSKAEKVATEKGRVPFVVERAHEVLLQAAFFADDKEASEHFRMVSSSRAQKELAEHALWRMEETLGRHNSEAHRKLVEPMMQQQKALIAACDELLKQAQKRVDINHLTIVQKAILAAKLEDQRPEVKRLAVLAADSLQEYSKSVMKAFCGSGADLSRADLLEYFVGPKGFLLEHYGMYVHLAPESPRYPFVHPQAIETNFEYSLKHNSAFDVESEIRDDLQGRGVRLPPRLVVERVPTKPQTVEVIQLRKVLIPGLREWDNYTPIAKKEVCQQLLKHLKWEQISPDEITLINNGLTTLADEKVIIKFTKYYNLAFRLNLWDPSLIYDNHNILRETPSYGELQSTYFSQAILLVNPPVAQAPDVPPAVAPAQPGVV